MVLSGICTCQPRLQTSHRPDGKMADALASTLACASANASVNSSGYVPQRPSKVPIARKNDDALALILACTTVTDASVNYSMYVPQRPSKVPIAPMGFSHGLRLCLQGGGVRINSGTVSFSSCTIAGNTAGNVRAHAQNFPSPRWENG